MTVMFQLIYGTFVTVGTTATILYGSYRLAVWQDRKHDDCQHAGVQQKEGSGAMTNTADPGQPHPEVVRRMCYDSVWPADKPFPLTPLEAWYLLQGWEVRPVGGITAEQFAEMPGKIEGGNGWIQLWQA